MEDQKTNVHVVRIERKRALQYRTTEQVKNQHKANINADRNGLYSHLFMPYRYIHTYTCIKHTVDIYRFVLMPRMKCDCLKLQSI